MHMPAVKGMHTPWCRGSSKRDAHAKMHMPVVKEMHMTWCRGRSERVAHANVQKQVFINVSVK